jgi:hypothetical protein
MTKPLFVNSPCGLINLAQVTQIQQDIIHFAGDPKNWARADRINELWDWVDALRAEAPELFLHVEYRRKAAE